MRSKAVKSFLILLCVFIITSLFLTSQDLAASAERAAEASSDYLKVISNIDMDRVKKHVEFLSNLQTRATGYPGNDEARKYIYDHFVKYGLTNVSYMPFPVTDAINYGSNITILSTNETITIHPLLPNKVATSATPGLVGHLIYVKDGNIFNFDGKNVENSIVLMDWMSHDNWIIAAKLGAQAVIFIPPSATHQEGVISEYGAEYRRYLPDIPFRFPRFYVDEKGAEVLLKHLGEKVRIVCDQRWTKITGYNVIGFVKGTEKPDKYIAIASYYDSYSIAPSIAPGAEEAVGVALLLELARLFSEEPPRLSVMFVAFGGHHQRMMGSAWWFTEYMVWYPYRPDSVPEPLDPEHKKIGNNTYMLLSLEPTSGSNRIVITNWAGTLMPEEVEDSVRETEPFRYISILTRRINEEKPLGRSYNFYIHYGNSLWLDSFVHTHVVPEAWKIFPHEHEVMVMSGCQGYLFTSMDSRPR